MKDHQPVSTADFVDAMAAATTQVTIVSTDGDAGRFGITVSAFASVSADPPMVLVCVNRASPAAEAIDQNGCFCVNLLGDAQSSVAECFAGRSDTYASYDFACADWATSITGSPVLSRASANFDCTVDTVQDAGTHRIYIGRVEHALTNGTPTLAFSQRAYQALSPLNRNER